MRVQHQSVTLVWRYLVFGKIRHALSKPTSVYALCGRRPGAGSWWYGDHSAAERTALHDLPECQPCARRVRPLPQPGVALVWVATLRRYISCHRIDFDELWSDASGSRTACGRWIGGGVFDTLTNLIQTHQVKPCERCFTAGRDETKT